MTRIRAEQNPRAAPIFNAKVVNGEVELKFIKNGFTGVEIECQRGTEMVSPGAA